MVRRKIFIILAALGLAIAPVFVPTIANEEIVAVERAESAEREEGTPQLRSGQAGQPTSPLVHESIDPSAHQSISLFLPFNVPSRWSNFNKIQNGAFIPSSEEDTWFIYGVFGPLEAVSAPQNAKYTLWGGKHNGIDFAAQEGLPVVAAARGEVIFVGERAGLTVVTQTGPYQITYAHLKAAEVKVGQKINGGELIGYVGHSGTVNPHLHLQVDKIIPQGRLAINPFTLFEDVDWSLVLIPDFPANRLDSEHERSEHWSTRPEYDMFSQPGFLW